MKRTFILVLMSLVLFGCSTMKNKRSEDKTTKENKNTLETVKIRETSPGGVTQLLAPTYVVKDTTIYKRGRTNTIYANYDKNGKVVDFGCINDKIDRFIEYQKKVNETKEVKEEIDIKEKETEIKPMTILMIFIGFALFILILIGGMFVYFKKSFGKVLDISKKAIDL